MSNLISRDEAVKTVIRMCAPICDYTKDMVKEINSLPSADRPKGEWMFNTEENGKSWFICSVCGDSIFHKSNFCPSCGAYMRGESE